MQFSKLSLFALAAPAFGQNLLNDLPSDIEAYIDSVETNPAVVQAVVPLITATPVLNLLGGVLTGGNKLDATQFAQSLEAAASEAIAAQPSDQQAIANSVIGHVESLAQTDNFVASVSNKITSYNTGAATATGSGTAKAASSGSGSGSVTSAAATGSGSVTSAAATGSGTAASAGSSSGATGAQDSSLRPGFTSSGSGGAASVAPAGSAVGTNAAAQPTGLALGALVGAVAGVAAIL